MAALIFVAALGLAVFAGWLGGRALPDI